MQQAAGAVADTLLNVCIHVFFLQAVAFGKLQGILDSKPLNLPGKNLINLGLLGGVLTCGGLFLTTGDADFATNMLWATAALGGVLGAHLTASIGTNNEAPAVQPGHVYVLGVTTSCLVYVEHCGP